MGTKLRSLVLLAESPTIRHRWIWQMTALAVAVIMLVLGAGYAIRGTAADHSLHLLKNLYSLHVHGWIMVVLAAFLIYTLGTYRRLTWLAIRLALFYSSLTATLIFLGWFFEPVSWGAPWWYVLSAVLCFVLMVLPPEPVAVPPPPRVGMDSA